MNPIDKSSLWPMRRTIRTVLRLSGFLIFVLVPVYYILSPAARPFYFRGVIYFLWFFALYQVVLYIRVITPFIRERQLRRRKVKLWRPPAYSELQEKITNSISNTEYFQHILAPRIARMAGLKVHRDRSGRERVDRRQAYAFFGPELAPLMVEKRRWPWERRVRLEDIREMMRRVENAGPQAGSGRVQ